MCVRSSSIFDGCNPIQRLEKHAEITAVTERLLKHLEKVRIF